MFFPKCQSFCLAMICSIIPHLSSSNIGARIRNKHPHASMQECQSQRLLYKSIGSHSCEPLKIWAPWGGNVRSTTTRLIEESDVGIFFGQWAEPPNTCHSHSLYFVKEVGSKGIDYEGWLWTFQLNTGSRN